MPKKQLIQDEIEEKEEVEEEQPQTYAINYPPGRHSWKQQGPYLVCKSCELQHAIWVSMDRVMTGEDEDGKPVLQER